LQLQPTNEALSTFSFDNTALMTVLVTGTAAHNQRPGTGLMIQLKLLCPCHRRPLSQAIQDMFALINVILNHGIQHLGYQQCRCLWIRAPQQYVLYTGVQPYSTAVLTSGVHDHITQLLSGTANTVRPTCF
jgi:hypothetical protein